MGQRALTAQEVEAALRDVPGWSLKNGRLLREFKFGSFVEAFGFLSSVALVAERMDHHPEIFNLYNRVKLELETHDANGITKLDFELAAAANKLAVNATSS